MKIKSIFLLGILLLLFGSVFFPDLTPIQTKRISFIVISFLLGIYLVIKSKNQDIKKINVDIFFAYMLFIFIYLLFRTHKSFINLKFNYFLSFLILYLFFKNLNFKQIKQLFVIIILICLIQSIYGLLQFFNLLPSLYSYPTGSFDNLAGFTACIVATLPFAIHHILHTAKNNKTFFYISLITLLFGNLIVFLSCSRTGIFALLIIYLIIFSYKMRKFLIKNIKSSLFIIFLSFILISVTLYNIKKDSTNGRILIWKTTLNMIKTNPIFGSKSGYFTANYMLNQASYFKENKNSQYILNADNVMYPFNEYLLLMLEYGIVGLSFIIGLLFHIIKTEKNKISPQFLSLISIIIFSLFSYPIRYPIIWILISLNLALIFRKENISMTVYFNVKWRKIKTLIFIIGLINFVFFTMNISYLYRWKKEINKYYSYNSKKEALVNFTALYKRLNKNYHFLYNYGLILNREKYFQESLNVLNNCENYFNNYDLQIILGNNLYNLYDYKINFFREKYI